MKFNKKHKWLIALLFCILLIVTTETLRFLFREKERDQRTHIRETVLKKYPATVKQLKTIYGLKPFVHIQYRANRDTEKYNIILIHGLDDPGKVWMNLAPVLESEGFSVWIMTYPNDQPITDSARFFLEQIQSNTISEAEKIVIIAHSMGGLVTREMLTAPSLGYSEKAGKNNLPAIESFIMVGTPNHGSGLAQFRIFSEIREQVNNLFKGNFHWLQGIIDGAGEAGIDLIPGSTFLVNLNNRPHPPNINMLTIAGVMSAGQKKSIEELAYDLVNTLPGETEPAAQKVEKILLSMSQQIGDGLVSVRSAQLPGVPLIIVKGTHLSIIRNIKRDSQRIPPAIPLIVSQLNQTKQEAEK